MLVLDKVLQQGEDADGWPHVNRVVAQGTSGVLTVPADAHTGSLITSVLSPMALGAAYGSQVGDVQ